MAYFCKISCFQVISFKIYGHFGMERCTKNKIHQNPQKRHTLYNHIAARVIQNISFELCLINFEITPKATRLIPNFIAINKGDIPGVQKNSPILQCLIFKSIEFDVFKFSTVIQHGLKQCTERFYLITSTHSNYAGI